VRGDIYDTGLFVHFQAAIQIPAARADRMLQLAVESIEVQVMPSGAFAAPDEGGPTLEEMQIIVEVDPRLRSFGQQRALLQVRRVHQLQVEMLLAALHALVRKTFAIRQPIDA